MVVATMREGPRPTRAELAGLARPRLEAMHAAGQVVIECYRDLAARDEHLVGEVLAGDGVFEEETHYPRDEVHDPVTRAHYYYHAHLPDEHGHFHLFLGRSGFPNGVRPMRPITAQTGETGLFAHLVSISVDARGLPSKLMATNAWVTGELFHPAVDVCAMLDKFVFENTQRPRAADRWLPAIIGLYRPYIEWLLYERDARIARWEAAHPGDDGLFARELAIVASLPLALDDHIAAVVRALRDSSAA